MKYIGDLNELELAVKLVTPGHVCSIAHTIKNDGTVIKHVFVVCAEDTEKVKVALESIGIKLIHRIVRQEQFYEKGN